MHQLTTSHPNHVQALRMRERELGGALQEADSKLASLAGSLTLATDRASEAEEAVRKLEGEATQLRSRNTALEAQVRTGAREVARLKVSWSLGVVKGMDGVSLAEAAMKHATCSQPILRTLASWLSRTR